jgi:hypothetical protein
MPDYTIGIAERIASVADSTATSNSVNRNYFQETSQSVVNVVNVAITPAAPTALDPTPDTTYATATDGDSVSTFGVQETPIVITLLATIEDAGALAEYLIRSVPAFWFSNLAISLNTLSEANKNIVANLEIGQQIAVTKTFPAGVVPQSVTEVLFVEGISHRVTPETHVVTIYTGPATTYLQWTLSNYLTTTTRTNIILNPNFETNVLFTENTSPAGSSIARSTAQAFIGTASCAGSTGATAGNLIFGTTASGTRFSVTGNQSYAFSFYFRSATVARLCRIRVLFYNSGGTNISTISGTDTISSTTAWQRMSITTTAPATAVTAILQLVVFSAGATETHYLDALLAETGSTVLPYFDGTYADPYTGYTLVSQQWNGTADGSTSTATWGLDSSQTGSPLNDSTYGLA